MAYDVNRRLNRAERVTNPEPLCEGCGGEPPKDAEHVVFWEGVTEEELGPTHCPRCGRTLIHEIYFADDPRHPMNRQGQ